MSLKYFNESEFTMGGVNVFDKMDTTFLRLLDSIREDCDFPFKINSSYRSEDYNKSIEGATRSKHLEGIAVDIHCTDSKKRSKIVYNALKYGLSVGVGKTFVHVDNRSNQLMFVY